VGERGSCHSIRSERRARSRARFSRPWPCGDLRAGQSQKAATEAKVPSTKVEVVDTHRPTALARPVEPRKKCFVSSQGATSTRPTWTTTPRRQSAHCKSLTLLGGSTWLHGVSCPPATRDRHTEPLAGGCQPSNRAKRDLHWAKPLTGRPAPTDRRAPMVRTKAGVNPWRKGQRYKVLSDNVEPRLLSLSHDEPPASPSRPSLTKETRPADGESAASST
jgi:hypothetical protein